MHSDPLMSDPANGNFRPSAACRDAGTNVGLTSDYNGIPVPIGSAQDIGMHEAKPTGGIIGDGLLSVRDELKSTKESITRSVLNKGELQ